MRFKIGDKVRVKTDIPSDSRKRTLGAKSHMFNRAMKENWSGKVLTIRRLYCSDTYLVAENDWLWQDWMLEPEVVKEEPKTPAANSEKPKRFKILIDYDGTTTTANIHEAYQGGSWALHHIATGFARRNPADEEDLETGITLAVQRMIEAIPKPDPWWPKLGDIVVVRDIPIYEDGTLVLVSKIDYIDGEISISGVSTGGLFINSFKLTRANYLNHISPI